MRGNKLFKVGSVVESFYNEGQYRIHAIYKVWAENSDKYFIYMTCLSNGGEISECCSYKEFADKYYVREFGNTIKVGDKLKYKGHVNHDCFSIDFIYRFKDEEGLYDFHLKSESTGDVINFIGTEEELLQKYDLQKGSVEMDKHISEYAKFKTPSPINCTQSILINQELKRIEREGNIDRILDKRDFKTLKKYLEE